MFISCYLLFLFLIGEKLFHSVVLVSAIQQCETVTIMCVWGGEGIPLPLSHPTSVGCHRVPGSFQLFYTPIIVPCYQSTYLIHKAILYDGPIFHVPYFLNMLLCHSFFITTSFLRFLFTFPSIIPNS